MKLALRWSLFFSSRFQLSVFMSQHRRRRHKKYIPEERYDIDGRLIKNEAALKAKTWNLRDIVSRLHKSRRRLLDTDIGSI